MEQLKRYLDKRNLLDTRIPKILIESLLNKPAKMFDFLSLSYIGVSLLGLCLLSLLTFNVPTSASNLAMQKQLTGSIFGAICILGMLAGIAPSRCSRMPHFKREIKNSSYKGEQQALKEVTTMFRGHHPMCSNFTSHVIQLGSKAYCAGCMGLVSGAIISLIGDLLYFFAGLHVGEDAIFVFWFGFVGVTCGLLQYNLPLNKGIIHFFLNAVFVLGAFLILIGVDEIKSSIILDFYLIILIVYWILARISLSRIEHQKTCSYCGSKSSCSFK